MQHSTADLNVHCRPALGVPQPPESMAQSLRRPAHPGWQQPAPGSLAQSWSPLLGPGVGPLVGRAQPDTKQEDARPLEKVGRLPTKRRLGLTPRAEAVVLGRQEGHGSGMQAPEMVQVSCPSLCSGAPAHQGSTEQISALC